MSALLAEQHLRSGATFEGGLPATYRSGVASEYAALTEGCGLLDLQDFGSLAVEGPERVSFLHRILSQDVKSLRPGEGAKGALLDLKGHIVTLLRVLAFEKQIALEAPADRLAPLEAALVHYKVGTPVRFRTEPLVFLGLGGPKAALALEGTPAEALPPEGHTSVTLAGETLRISRTTLLPGGGFVLGVSESGVPAVWDALMDRGAQPAGRKALDLARIEYGRAWFGRDITSQNLLHEADLVSEYHSSQKGCYIGQEVIARLEARGGNVNKKLRILRAQAPLEPQAPLLHGSEDAGFATTTGVSPRFGPVALAFVRRPHFEPGSVLTAAGAPAEVVGPLRETP